MKKVFLTSLFLFFSIFSFSQEKDINEIQNKIDNLEKTKENYSGPQRQAIESQISVLEQEKSNLIISLKTKRQSEIESSNNNVKTYQYNQQNLSQIRQNQIQTQNNYSQELNGFVNSLSRSMSAFAYQNIKTELNRRIKTANTFVNFHSDRLSKLSTIYNQIKTEKFNTILNGLYSGHILNNRRYSFVNNQELTTEIPCLVKIENNVVKNIYQYNKENMEIDFPIKYPENSTLLNGFVTYADFETMETLTLLIVEPYVSNKPKEYNVIKNGVGYISVWSDNEKDEGKTVYIQELDNKGNIIRETSTTLIYYKNEKMIINDKLVKIPFNTGNELKYFGEVTQTVYGRLPLYPKISNSNTKPLNENEHRIVEIKKYRE